ncbi:MAG TPA: biosynthetic peptidoglycan transglycosylase [Candidatus Polarisedimenticolia bacterium]|nr:biosynthetic peptidoglycan transglycosylase [Candidatus Polarisedimenticolia bacterium]
MRPAGVLKRALRLAAALLALAAAAAVAAAGYGWLRAPALAAREMALAPDPLEAGDLPPDWIDALLQVEDPTFLDHHGIDLTTPGAGMTTLTQGLAKFLYFDSFRPGLAKIPQSLFALGLDARLDKDRQLALFLNRSYMGTIEGRAVRGFQEAARAYFGRPAPKLDKREWLALVAMCAGPDAYNVAARPDHNRRRVARIERLLAGSCRPSGVRDVHYEDCD